MLRRRRLGRARAGRPGRPGPSLSGRTSPSGPGRYPVRRCRGPRRAPPVRLWTGGGATARSRSQGCLLRTSSRSPAVRRSVKPTWHRLRHASVRGGLRPRSRPAGREHQWRARLHRRRRPNTSQGCCPRRQGRQSPAHRPVARCAYRCRRPGESPHVFRAHASGAADIGFEPFGASSREPALFGGPAVRIASFP